METINNIYAIYTTDGQFLCLDSLEDVAGILPDLATANRIRVKKLDSIDEASKFLRVNNARRQIMLGRCDGDESFVDLPQVNSLPYGTEICPNKGEIPGGCGNE